MHLLNNKKADIGQVFDSIESRVGSLERAGSFGGVVRSNLRRICLGIGLGIGGLSTLAAQSSGIKTNTVLLSPPALETMDHLISVKPGRSAKDVAATGSMQPVFDENYILIVEEKRFEDLAFGDIVIFRGDWLSGKSVAHRLVQQVAYGRGWQTKGDHCRAPDPQYLTREKYKGCVAVAAIHKLTGNVKPLVVRPN